MDSLQYIQNTKLYLPTWLILILRVLSRAKPGGYNSLNRCSLASLIALWIGSICFLTIIVLLACKLLDLTKGFSIPMVSTIWQGWWWERTKFLKLEPQVDRSIEWSKPGFLKAEPTITRVWTLKILGHIFRMVMLYCKTIISELSDY